jgi:hypothetical protein
LDGLFLWAIGRNRSPEKTGLQKIAAEDLFHTYYLLFGRAIGWFFILFGFLLFSKFTF